MTPEGPRSMVPVIWFGAGVFVLLAAALGSIVAGGWRIILVLCIECRHTPSAAPGLVLLVGSLMSAACGGAVFWASVRAERSGATVSKILTVLTILLIVIACCSGMFGLLAAIRKWP